MYVVYCQNKPKSEHVVSEFGDSYFEVSGRGALGEGRQRISMIRFSRLHNYPVPVPRSSGSSWGTACSSMTSSSNLCSGS